VNAVHNNDDGTAMNTLNRPSRERLNISGTVSNEYAEVTEAPFFSGTTASPYTVPRETRSPSKDGEPFYGLVPTHTLRGINRSATGPAVELEKIYELVESKEAKHEDVPYSPPAKELKELYSQLARGQVLELPRSALIMKEHLASGEFGNIHKGIWNSPYADKDVAVKTLKSSAKDEERLKFLQEAAIMAQFRHPHIVKLFGAVTMDEPILLILELMSNGDLLQWLQSTHEMNWGKSSMSPELPTQLLQFCREIADGMRYLSNKDFIHRDLAARNILLDSDLRCKIADFGLSRDLGEEESEYYVTSGRNIPVRITDPEVLFYGKYSSKSDVWSYGMLVYEIWSLGRRPFNALKTQQIIPFLQTHKGYVLPPPPGCPREIYHLMVQCWDWNHHSRPSFTKIVTFLSQNSQDLLEIPSHSLSSLDDPGKAAVLGASLIAAQDLYKELQQLYIS
jgi:ephrin-B